MSELTRSCCVNKCPNKFGRHGVRFFAFPSRLFRPVQRNQWIQSIQNVNGTSWCPTSISEVCSEHFITKEPHVDPENKDFVPSLFNLHETGSEIREGTLTIKQFALEYIRHDDLLKKPIAGPMSEGRKRAYRLLSESLNVSIKQVLALEKCLYNYLEHRAQLPSGAKKRVGCHRTAAWANIVEQKLLTVQAYNDKAAGRRVCPARVVLALRAAAAARGRLCCTPLYADVRRALHLPVAVNDLHVAWVKTQQASLNDLAASSRMGDWPPFATTLDTMKVADLVLMHTDVDTHRLINDESIFLYDEAKALELLIQLIHTHQCEGDMSNRVRAQRWTKLYKDYIQSGRVASLVALQRRWHELALQARARLAAYWRRTRRPRAALLTLDPPRDNLPFPAPIHIDIIKRYPHIALKPFTSWRRLIACGSIIPQPLEDNELNKLDSEITHIGPAINNTTNHGSESNVLYDKNTKNFTHQDDCLGSITITPQQSDDSESDQNEHNTQNQIQPATKNQDQNEHSEQNKIHTVSQKEVKNVCPTIAELNKINPTDCQTEIYFSSDSDDEIEPLSEDVKVQIALPDICNRLVFTDDVDSEFNRNEDSNNTGFDKKLLMDARVNIDKIDDIFKHLHPSTSHNISEINTNMHKKSVNNDQFDKTKDDDGIEKNHNKIGDMNDEVKVIKESLKKSLKRRFLKNACMNFNNELSKESEIIKKIARKETDFDIESKTDTISTDYDLKKGNKGAFSLNFYNSIENLTDSQTKTIINETSGAKSDIYNNRVLSNQSDTEDGLTIDVNFKMLDNTNDWNDSDGARVAKEVEVIYMDEDRRFGSGTVTAVSSMPKLRDWDNPAANEIKDLVRSSATEDITEIMRNTERIRKKREQEVDFINKMPTEKQLESLLDELSFATPVQQGMSHKQCCLARQIRDLSDQRAYRGYPPLPPHRHKDETCNCCCQYLCARMMTIKHNAERMALWDELTALIKKASITAIKRRIQDLNSRSAKAIEKSALMMNSMRSKKQALFSPEKKQEKTQLTTKDISVADLKASAIPLQKPSITVELLPKSATCVEPLPNAVTSVESSTLSSTSVEQPKNLVTPVNTLTKSFKSVELSTKSSKSVKMSSKSSTKTKRGRPKKLQSASSKSTLPGMPELSPTSEDKDDNGYSEWRKQKNINASHFNIAGMYKKQNTIRLHQKSHPSLKLRLNETSGIKKPPKSNETSAYDENESNDDSDILSNVIPTAIHHGSDILSQNFPESVAMTTPKKTLESLALSTKSSTSEEASKNSSTSEKSSKNSSTSEKASKDSSSSENQSSKSSTKSKRGRPKKLQSAPTRCTLPRKPEASPTSSEDQDDNGYSEWRRQKNINANHFQIAGMCKKKYTIRPPQKSNPSLRPRLNVTLDIKMPPKSNKKYAYDKNESNDGSDIFCDVILTAINPESDYSFPNSPESVAITTSEKTSNALPLSRKLSTSESLSTNSSTAVKTSSKSSTSVDRSTTIRTPICPELDKSLSQKSHESVTIHKRSTAQKDISLPTESTFQSDPKKTLPDNSFNLITNINLVDKPVLDEGMLSEIPLPSPPSFGLNPATKSTNITASSSGTAQKAITLHTESTFQRDPNKTLPDNLIKSITNVNLVDKPVLDERMLSEIPLPSPPSFGLNPATKSTNITASSSGTAQKAITLPTESTFQRNPNKTLPDNLIKSITNVNLVDTPVLDEGMLSEIPLPSPPSFGLNPGTTNITASNSGVEHFNEPSELMKKSPLLLKLLHLHAFVPPLTTPTNYQLLSYSKNVQ